jgi:hypothetical protein
MEYKCPIPKKLLFGFLLLLTSGTLARQVENENYSSSNIQAPATTPTQVPTPAQKRILHPSVAVWQTLRKLKPTDETVPIEVKSLLGKTTEVAGFAIMNELAYDPTGSPKMSEFLITPVPGGCIHVPPPPPNFILHVTMPRGKSTTLSFLPLWLKGKITLPKDVKDRKFYSYEMTPTEVEDFYQHVKKTDDKKQVTE